MKRRNEESKLQEWFALWLRSEGVLFNASMSGVNLGIVTAVIRKRMGCQRGFPDIVIYESRGGFHGMAIELKVKGGAVQPDQIIWKECLQVRGYWALIMPANLEFQQAQEWLEKETRKYLSSGLRDTLEAKKEEVCK